LTITEIQISQIKYGISIRSFIQENIIKYQEKLKKNKWPDYDIGLQYTYVQQYTQYVNQATTR